MTNTRESAYLVVGRVVVLTTGIVAAFRLEATGGSVWGVVAAASVVTLMTLYVWKHTREAIEARRASEAEKVAEEENLEPHYAHLSFYSGVVKTTKSIRKVDEGKDRPYDVYDTDVFPTWVDIGRGSVREAPKAPRVSEASVHPRQLTDLMARLSEEHPSETVH